MVTFPYNTTDFAFTLEDVFINFSTENVDTYFDLKVTITYFEFFSATEKEKILEYKIPLLNQEQKYNVGRKIHRNLDTLQSYTNTFGFQYKTAKVSFLATEINIADGTPENTTFLNNVKFIAGPKPKLITNNIALLSTNTNYERITKNGFFICNFLLPEGNHNIKVFKNGIESLSEDIIATAADNVFSKKIVVKDFNGAKGDVFSIKIDGTIIEKKVVIFPNNKQSKQLVFVDSFKLFSSLECTGDFNFPDEYNQITHKYKRNLVEVLEIVETEQVNKFQINTGWLLKTDTETLHTFSLSKKAFLVENNEQLLELAPISKKLIKEDSDGDLYEYNLDFQINKENA